MRVCSSKISRIADAFNRALVTMDVQQARVAHAHSGPAGRRKRSFYMAIERAGREVMQDALVL